MARFENKMDISTIRMYGIKKKFFCPIGQSECTYEINIEMVPDETICDYLEVETFIEGMEREQTLESACSILCNYMADEYQPFVALVKVKCEDAKHMPVEVTKQLKKKVGMRV